MFVGLAEMEESYFADRTSIFVALGPVTKIPHTQSLIFQYLLLWYAPVANTLALLHIDELLSANWLTDTATDLVCGIVPDFCEFLLGFFTNSDPTLDDDDRYAVYMGHEPNGSSTRAILHYSQNIKEDRF